MRYPLVSILNLMYKLYTTINIEILNKSGNTNFTDEEGEIQGLKYL